MIHTASKEILSIIEKLRPYAFDTKVNVLKVLTGQYWKEDMSNTSFNEILQTLPLNEAEMLNKHSAFVAQMQTHFNSTPIQSRNYMLNQVANPHLALVRFFESRELAAV